MSIKKVENKEVNILKNKDNTKHLTISTTNIVKGLVSNSIIGAQYSTTEIIIGTVMYNHTGIFILDLINL